MLEHDLLHFAAYDVHKQFDIFFPLLLGDVELACIRPDAFGLLDDFSIGFGGFAVCVKFFLDLVRLFCCYRKTVRFVRRCRSGEADQL